MGTSPIFVGMRDKPVVIWKNRRLWEFSELRKYRELFWMLAWRDFKVRYAQTFIGVLWGVIQPVLTIVILYVVFGRFAQVDTGDIPHIVYSTVGVMAWTYFAFVLSNAGNSIISAQAMIRKIYFPRIIIPLSKAVVGFIDMAITSAILVVLMFVFEVPVSSNILFLPLFIIFNVLVSLGLGILISALTIRYRDVQYVVPFAIQLGLYITPTAYPAEFAITHLPSWASVLYFMNPMAGIVEGYRWAVLGTPMPGELAWVSVISAVVLIVVGLTYFQKVDGKIADHV